MKQPKAPYPPKKPRLREKISYEENVFEMPPKHYVRRIKDGNSDFSHDFRRRITSNARLLT